MEYLTGFFALTADPVELAETPQYYTEVLVSPTWDCNLSCTYCFVKKKGGLKKEGVMSPVIAGRVIDALDEGLGGVENICVHFYGGEPFIHLPAIETMVNRALGKKTGRFSFAVTTNGTILSENVIEVLKKGKFRIVLSIDGPAAVHDECRKTREGAPTHARVMRFLETVRSKTSCTICASSVVRSGWDLERAAQYLRSLPVDSLKAQIIRVPPSSPYALNEKEKKDYLHDLEVMGQHVIEELEAGGIPMDHRFSSRVLQLLKGESRPAYCGAGINIFGVTPSGNVLPCLLVDEPGAVLGHIDAPPDTWKNAGQQWRKKPLTPKCKSCASLYLCGGGCPAILSVCGEVECEVVTKNCEVAASIYKHFSHKPETLLALAGIT